MEVGQCKQYNLIQKKLPEVVDVYSTTKVLDIEDWGKEGISEKFCTYYANRNLVHNAKMIILPFELLMDPQTINSLEDYIENSIVIIEDADLFESSAINVN